MAGKAESDGLDRLFDLAIRKGASDILVTAGSPPRLRIHGELRAYGTKALSPEDAKRFCYGVIRNEQVARFEIERELDFSFNLGGHRFRGNLYFQRGCVVGAFRLIATEVPSLEALRLPRSSGNSRCT